MLNHIDLAGRITADPNYKETEKYKLCSFTVACERDFQKGKDRATDFIRCSAFGNTATFIHQYFVKGDMIVLSGRVQVDEDKDAKRSYYSVKVDNAYFGGAKKFKEEKDEGPKYEELYEDNEDIPF